MDDNLAKIAGILFWTSLLVIVYTYVGYGILLTIMVKLKRWWKKKAGKNEPADWQPVSIVICAYNEESVIEQKLRNTLQLEYSAGKMNVIVVTDGSTDRTNELVLKFEGVQLTHEAQRRGKVAAVNRVMRQINDPFVIFTDANTFLNPGAVKNIMRHYDDPTIGGVAGEKRVYAPGGGATAGEGMYWKYESYLKRMDAELHSVVGAAGELFSIRANLYQPVEEDTIIEDFVLSMRICGNGYRIAYEPGAYAMETASVSITEERKRKIRIAAGAFQAMQRLGKEISFLKQPLLGFQYYSHRVLRWTIAPLAMIVLLVTGFFLAVYTQKAVYQWATALQLLFYLMGFLGWKFSTTAGFGRLFFLPYYFLFMNISVFMGWSRYRKGNQTVLWEKAGRS